MNFIDIIIGVICALIVALTVVVAVINKKKGKSACGCDCSKCSACKNNACKKDERQN